VQPLASGISWNISSQKGNSRCETWLLRVNVGQTHIHESPCLVGNISNTHVRQIAWTDPCTDSAFNCWRNVITKIIEYEASHTIKHDVFDHKYFIILVLNFNTSGCLQSNSKHHVSCLKTLCLLSQNIMYPVSKHYVSCLKTLCLKTSCLLSQNIMSPVSKHCLMSQTIMSPVSKHCLLSQNIMSPVSKHYVSCFKTPCLITYVSCLKKLCLLSQNIMFPVSKHCLMSQNIMSPVSKRYVSCFKTLCLLSQNIMSPVSKHYVPCLKTLCLLSQNIVSYIKTKTLLNWLRISSNGEFLLHLITNLRVP